MKLVAFTCPSCGANLDVDVQNKVATCQFCGARFPVEDEARTFDLKDAAQAGYEFEKGRQRAQAEAGVMFVPPTTPAQQKPAKKRKTWLWVLGWIFMFPIPLTIIMLRKKNLSPLVRYVIIAAGWLVYLAIGMSDDGDAAKNKIKDTGSEVAISQEAGENPEDATVSPTEEAAEPDQQPEQASPAEAASGVIVLEAGVPGEFGREITTYGGGSEYDTGTRLGWFVPEGTYTVRNLDESSLWEQVNFGSPEPVTNEDGFLESRQFGNVLVKPNETADIYIPAGGCIYITSASGRLELTRR